MLNNYKVYNCLIIYSFLSISKELLVVSLLQLQIPQAAAYLPLSTSIMQS